MTITTLVKHEDDQKLWMHAHLNFEELNEHKRDGWFYHSGDKVIRKAHWKGGKKK